MARVRYTVVSDQNTVSVSGTVTDTEFVYQSCKLFEPRCRKHYLHRVRVRKIDDKWILHICYRTHLALCDPKKFLSNPGLINRLELACSQNWPWNIGLGFMLHCTNGSWYELTLRKNVCVSQIGEQMSGPDLHVFTLKFLALQQTGLSPMKK